MPRSCQTPLRYLSFERSEGAEDVTTLEAMASTSAQHHAAVLGEVDQVLAWAWRNFPHTHGPADDGADWDHALQVHLEDGGWHVAALTLTGSARFVDAFVAAFASALA